jgi:hypothetical protein
VTSGVIKMDRGISRTLPLILMLLPDSNDKYKDNNLVRVIIRSFEERPVLLCSIQTPEELMKFFFEEIVKMLTSKELLVGEAASFADDACDPMFIKTLLKGLLVNKKILHQTGIDVNEKALMELQDVIEGKHPAAILYTSKLDDMMRAVKPELLKATKEIQTDIDKDFYVTCFSEKNDNALMWAHYANEHKGFCIEYDLLKTQDKDFLVNLYPVIYTKMRGRVPLSLFDVSNTGELLPVTSDASTIDIICEMLKKSAVWDYEEEWRFVVHEGIKRKEPDKYGIDCISKIILGCRIETKYIDRILQLCRDRKWNLSIMRLDDYSYKLHEEVILGNQDMTADGTKPPQSQE